MFRQKEHEQFEDAMRMIPNVLKSKVVCGGEEKRKKGVSNASYPIILTQSVQLLAFRVRSARNHPALMGNSPSP